MRDLRQFVAAHLHTHPSGGNREGAGRRELDRLVEHAQRRGHERVVVQHVLLLGEIGRLIDHESTVVEDRECGVTEGLHELSVGLRTGHGFGPEIIGDIGVLERPQSIRERCDRTVRAVPDASEIGIVGVGDIVLDTVARNPSVELHAEVGPRRIVLKRHVAQEEARTATAVSREEPGVERPGNQRLDVARGGQCPDGIRVIGVGDLEVGAGCTPEKERRTHRNMFEGSHGIRSPQKMNSREAVIVRKFG